MTLEEGNYWKALRGTLNVSGEEVGRSPHIITPVIPEKRLSAFIQSDTTICQSPPLLQALSLIATAHGCRRKWDFQQQLSSILSNDCLTV
jgi:hypothetical protein